MRRFSQRNPLVTLSDINITPLLDLAFVLLIIFVITTPLLEQGIDMKLPKGGKPSRPLQKSDLRVVDVTSQGSYALSGKRLPLPQIVTELVRVHRLNPNLVVRVRGDEATPWKNISAVIDRLSSQGVTDVSFGTAPEDHR